MRLLLTATGTLTCFLFLGCVGDSPLVVPDVDASVKADAAVVDTSVGDAFKCDAPKVVCTNACVDLQTDDGNCGKCGHACKGDGCDKGLCKTTDLLTGLNFPTSIAQNPKFPLVFVNTKPRVVKCAKTGCGNSPTPAWTGSAYVTAQSSPLAVGTFDFGVFVYDGQQTEHLGYAQPSQANADPSVVTMEGFGAAQLVAFDDDNTFVHQWAYGVVECNNPFSCSTSLGQKLVGEVGATAVAVQSGSPGYIAWNEYNNIDYCSRGSTCTKAPLLQTSLPNATIKFMSASSTTLYWVQFASGKSQVYSCPFPAGCTTGTLLVDGEAAMDGFVADDSGMYWTESAAGIVRGCFDTKKGCSTNALTIATNQAVPTGLVIDKEYVFWTQTGGQPNQGKVTRMVR